jgi:hypothetical protein
MKYLISFLGLIIIIGVWSDRNWDDPDAAFNALDARVHPSSINIEWRLEKDINAACERASRDFGNDGFNGQDIQGCAFWWGERCVIITKPQPTMHTLGHEISAHG